MLRQSVGPSRGPSAQVSSSQPMGLSRSTTKTPVDPSRDVSPQPFRCVAVGRPMDPIQKSMTKGLSRDPPMLREATGPVQGPFGPCLIKPTNGPVQGPHQDADAEQAQAKPMHPPAALPLLHLCSGLSRSQKCIGAAPVRAWTSPTVSSRAHRAHVHAKFQGSEILSRRKKCAVSTPLLRPAASSGPGHTSYRSHLACLGTRGHMRENPQ
jgi:hypothetical protein